MFKWLATFNHHFMEDCALWYKKWSSWWAFLWGAVGVLFWNIPQWLPSLVGGLPQEVRVLLSPMVLLFLTGLPILVTNLKQKKLEDAAKQLVQSKPND